MTLDQLKAINNSTFGTDSSPLYLLLLDGAEYSRLSIEPSKAEIVAENLRFHIIDYLDAIEINQKYDDFLTKIEQGEIYLSESQKLDYFFKNCLPQYYNTGKIMTGIDVYNLVSTPVGLKTTSILKEESEIKTIDHYGLNVIQRFYNFTFDMNALVKELVRVVLVSPEGMISDKIYIVNSFDKAPFNHFVFTPTGNGYKISAG